VPDPHRVAYKCSVLSASQLLGHRHALISTERGLVVCWTSCGVLYDVLYAMVCAVWYVPRCMMSTAVSVSSMVSIARPPSPSLCVNAYHMHCN